MSDDYLDAVLAKISPGKKLRMVLSHDRDSTNAIRRAQEIKKRYGAVAYSPYNESLLEAWYVIT